MGKVGLLFSEVMLIIGLLTNDLYGIHMSECVKTTIVVGCAIGTLKFNDFSPNGWIPLQNILLTQSDVAPNIDIKPTLRARWNYHFYPINIFMQFQELFSQKMIFLLSFVSFFVYFPIILISFSKEDR